SRSGAYFAQASARLVLLGVLAESIAANAGSWPCETTLSPSRPCSRACTKTRYVWPGCHGVSGTGASATKGPQMYGRLPVAANQLYDTGVNGVVGKSPVSLSRVMSAT